MASCIAFDELLFYAVTESWWFGLDMLRFYCYLLVDEFAKLLFC